MATRFYDITLALAGMCQSAKLVQQLAYHGNYTEAPFQTSISSILTLDASSTLAVFGERESVLNLGLTTLKELMSDNRQKESIELTRYLLSMIVLEKKLSQQNGALSELGSRIAQLDRQLSHFDLLSETMQNAIASIYVDIISKFEPRIQVVGSPIELNKPLIQANIRSCLLAGIRAAVLWRQMGGTRMQLLFSRRRILEQVALLLGAASG